MFTVMYHSLLIGASLFAPLPFLDEKIAAYLWKRMVTELAKNHHRDLTDAQLTALSYEYKFILSDGCLLVLKRVFKQLSQELVFFLEWGKALDMATDAYYSGYLLNELFASETFDSARVPQYAVAIQNAKKGIAVKLMRSVIKGTFESSKGVVLSIVQWLTRVGAGYLNDLRTRGIKRKNDPAFEQNMGGVFEANQGNLETLIGQLRTGFDAGLGRLPQEHFEELRARLFAELTRVDDASHKTTS